MDINELDLTNIARWPAAARAVIILFLMGGVIFLGYWFHTKDQLLVLADSERKEADLRVIFEKKAEQAVNLEAYEKQLEEMRESFGAMLRQLPNQTEVAGRYLPDRSGQRPGIRTVPAAGREPQGILF
jgi:type IV pilus assembly protein PilO